MRRYSLPKHRLHPLLPTWSAEFARVMNLSGWRISTAKADARLVREAILRRERPFRVINQRRRLQVCLRVVRLWRHPASVLSALRNSAGRPVWMGGRS